MPPIYATGYIDIFVEIDGSSDLHFKGKFLVETPFQAPELVKVDEAVTEMDPKTIKIEWDYHNLTMDRNAMVSITLYGYKESTITPQLIFIDTIVVRTF